MQKRTWTVCAALLAACGSGAPVSVSARIGSSSVAPSRGVSGGLVVADGVTLDRARVLLRQLRVERKSSGPEVRISEGPELIDVSGDALGGSVQQLLDASVPAGTYDKLKLSVHPVQAAPAGAAAGFADLVARRASVLLEGTVDGQPFTFASGLEAELEHEGQFVVGGSNANITVNLDPTVWFKDASGARLDPSDPANHAAIEANIRASFSAFQDDDEEGTEDRQGGHHDAADGGDDHGHDGADAGDDHGHDGADAGDDHGHDGHGGSGGGGGHDGGSGHH